MERSREVTINLCLKQTSIKEIVVEATAGSVFGNCIREGIELAAKEWVPVRVIHNDKCWLIKPEDLWAAAKGPDK